MEKISEIIKEAKPLYYRNKVRAKRIRTTCLTLFVFMSLGISAFGGYTMGENALISSVNSSSTTSSSLEDSGFPVDEYGFITLEY